jgi:hypothetical protein
LHAEPALWCGGPHLPKVLSVCIMWWCVDATPGQRVSQKLFASFCLGSSLQFVCYAHTLGQVLCGRRHQSGCSCWLGHWGRGRAGGVGRSDGCSLHVGACSQLWGSIGAAWYCTCRLMYMPFAVHAVCCIGRRCLKRELLAFMLSTGACVGVSLAANHDAGACGTAALYALAL